MLGIIRAPSLQVLSLGSFSDDDLEGLPSASSGIQPQFPLLRALFFRDNSAGFPAILQILEAFPRVSHVTCCRRYVYLLSLLRKQDSDVTAQPRYWKELRSLALPHVDVSNPFYNLEVRQLLFDRISMGAPITHILLDSAETASAFQTERSFDGIIQYGMYTDDFVRQYLPYYGTTYCDSQALRSPLTCCRCRLI